MNGDVRRKFVQIFLQIFKPENRSADFDRRLSVVFAAGQQVASLGQESVVDVAGSPVVGPSMSFEGDARNLSVSKGRLAVAAVRMESD